MNKGLSASLAYTKLDRVFFPAFNYAGQPEMTTADNPTLFKQETAASGKVVTSTHGGVGYFEEHAEEQARTLANVAAGDEQTYTVAEYKKTIALSKEFYRDDLWASSKAAVQMAGVRARTTKDRNAFDLYPGGFETHKTNDGLFIWSASHAMVGGGTESNLSSGAWAAGTAETLFRKLWELKSEDGGAGGDVPMAILVPPILLPDAHEVLKSVLKSGTAENQLNYFSTIYGTLQIYSSVFVGSAHHVDAYANANTAHYLLGANHRFTRWTRESLYTRLVDWTIDDYDRYKYKMGYAETFGCPSWESAVGSTGV